MSSSVDAGHKSEWWTVDKAAWGDGPWQHEPDKRQWRDAATGLPCLIVRNAEIGQLCGYVGVPPSHPAHGKTFDDGADFNVHGGLTFAGGCQQTGDESRGVCHVPAPGETENVWWLGFDCAHAFDLSPGLQATMRSCGAELTWPAAYRNVDYVASECAALAKQLAVMVGT